jgi:plasmid stabilization system protein ParE
MPYRVEFSDRALRDIELLYLEKNAAESNAAARWYNRLEQALLALESHPSRCSVASESRKCKRTLRNLLHGRKPNVYRVIYEVDEAKRTVWALTIRHGARRKLKPAELE